MENFEKKALLLCQEGRVRNTPRVTRYGYIPKVL